MSIHNNRIPPHDIEPFRLDIDDDWIAEEEQIDYQAAMDAKYWETRKEDAYRRFLIRKWGIIARGNEQ